MMDWIISNVGNIAVGGILLVIVVIVIMNMIKRKKKGKGTCGCGCENCPGKDSCH